jgi:phage recombination protein Bet
MTTALTANNTWGMAREQLDLLKRTIAKGTNDDEFALFMATSQRLGLDPFAKQIYAVMRYNKAEDRKTMAIQVSIDGFRATADKTGQSDGQEGPFWCGSDGVWREVWLHESPPAGAKVIVFRKGQTRGYTGIATYESYVQEDRNGDPNDMWRRLPDVMLAKCAEALALRKAFPAQLSGVYTPDEMGQADNPEPTTPTRKAQEQVVELDADRLADLLGRMSRTRNEDERLKLTGEINQLVPAQKDLLREAWGRARGNDRRQNPAREAERKQIEDAVTAEDLRQ